MKKKLFLFLFFLLLVHTTNSQQIVPLNNLEVTLTSGKVIKKSKFYCFNDYLVHQETSKKYKFPDLAKIIYFGSTDSIKLEVISLGKEKTFKEIKYALGVKLYSDKKIKIYHTYFSLHISDYLLAIKKYNNKKEVFAKRYNESKLYSVGFKDGSGWANIRKRLLKFFHDCPELKKALRKGKAKEKDIFSVIDFYYKNCN